jgi:hypothetical protein
MNTSQTIQTIYGLEPPDKAGSIAWFAAPLGRNRPERITSLLTLASDLGKRRSAQR